MVRVVRLERTVSWSQTRRDTNFAIPGYLILNHYSTKLARLKDFSVCGHSCGQSRFCVAFGNRGKSRKRRCYKALRHFTLPCPGYRHGTPKPPALPAAPHPDLAPIISQLGGFFKFFFRSEKRAAVFPGSTLFVIPILSVLLLNPRQNLRIRRAEFIVWNLLRANPGHGMMLQQLGRSLGDGAVIQA